MKAISHQLSAFSFQQERRNQNETRENIMIRYDNNSIVIPERATTPHVIPDGRQADPESIPGCPSQPSMGWKRPGFRIIANAISGMTNGIFVAALFLAAPGAALAQSECGVQMGTTPVVCDQDSYTGGVTYDAVGDLFIDFTADPTVEIEAGGIDLTGDGSESITFNSATDSSADGTELESRDTVGALLGVTTVDGDIDILTAEIDADGQNASGVTHGVRAEATGTGNISISNNTFDGLFNNDIDAAGGQNPADSIGIEALTAGGDITIAPVGLIGAASANVRGNRYGIRAVSSGAGNIQILATDIANFSGSEYGIYTETAGGDIGIEFTGIGSGDGDIYASTEGAGDIAIRNTRRHLGIYESDIVTTVNGGTGSTLLDLRGSEFSIDSLDATIGTGGLVLNYGSDAFQRTLSADVPSAYVQDVTVQGPGDVAITFLDHSDQITDPDASSSARTRTLGEHRLFRGVHDFSGVGGRVTVSMEANTYWLVEVAETSLMSPGDDRVDVLSGGGLFTNFVSPDGFREQYSYFPSSPKLFPDEPAVIDFGDGEDVVSNAGDIYLSPIWSRAALTLNDRGDALNFNYSSLPNALVIGNSAEMRLENLERFENAGTIWMGAAFGNAGKAFVEGAISPEAYVSGEYRDDVFAGTDHAPDDILTLPGTTFVGLEGSRIVMDVNLNAIGQSECTDDARGENGQMANDCVNLRGATSSVEGRTAIEVFDIFSGQRGGYNPDGNVVMDLTGADPANIDPDAFVLAPESSGYTPNIGNGAIDKGLFFYTLAFDPELQQFRLYGLPSTGSQQFPLLATAANGLWDTATDGWFEQRADRRGQDKASGLGGGLWFRAARDSGDRDLMTPIVAGGETFEFDNSYQQDDTAVTFGLDLIDRNAGDSRWTAGGMLGYARSRVDFEDSGNNALMSGMHAGLYGSVTFGAFYVDAAYNQTWLDLDYDVPALGLLPEGTELGTDIESSGLRLEGGWRLAMGRFGITPLVGYSHVTTTVDDIDVPNDDALDIGNVAQFDDTTSQRGSAGVRLSLDNLWADVAPTTLSLTARAINEFDGKSHVTIANDVSPIDPTSEDEFDGTFTQVTGGLSMTNTAKTVSGYLNVDGTFESDYESLGLSAGFRYEW